MDTSAHRDALAYLKKKIRKKLERKNNFRDLVLSNLHLIQNPLRRPNEALNDNDQHFKSASHFIPTSKNVIFNCAAWQILRAWADSCHNVAAYTINPTRSMRASDRYRLTTRQLSPASFLLVNLDAMNYERK